MKKFYSLVVAMVALAMTACFTSCGSDDDDDIDNSSKGTNTITFSLGNSCDDTFFTFGGIKVEYKVSYTNAQGASESHTYTKTVTSTGKVALSENIPLPCTFTYQLEYVTSPSKIDSNASYSFKAGTQICYAVTLADGSMGSFDNGTGVVVSKTCQGSEIDSWKTLHNTAFKKKTITVTAGGSVSTADAE